MIGLKVKELFFIKKKAIRTQSTQYNIQWISHTYLEITEMAQTTNKLIFPILENDRSSMEVDGSKLTAYKRKLKYVFHWILWLPVDLNGSQVWGFGKFSRSLSQNFLKFKSKMISDNTRNEHNLL